MTWKEFKKFIDEGIKKNDDVVSDDTKIDGISYPNLDSFNRACIHISFEHAGMLITPKD